MVRPSFKSITTRTLAMKFAEEFLMVYAFYGTIFAERGGVSAAGIGTILAAGIILALTFEIPTGILADSIPRKYVIMSAIISRIIWLTIWLLFPSFLGYLIGIAFLSLAGSLESGALQAYLYGTLGKEAKRLFGKFWSRVNAMLMSAWATSFVLVYFIGVNYPLIILLSILALVIAFSIACTLPRDNLALADESVKPQIFKTAVTHIRKTPSLRKLLLEAVFILAVTAIWVEYIQLYYYHVGVRTRYIPLLLAFGSYSAALIMWNLHTLGKLLDRYKLLIALLMTFLFIASFGGGVVIAAAGGLIFSRYVRTVQIQFESNMQHLANEKARATITSIAAFSAQLMAAIAILLIGFLAEDNNIVTPMRWAVVIGMSVFACVHLFTKARQARPANQ